MSWRERQALKDKEKEDQEMRRQVRSLAGSACLTYVYPPSGRVNLLRFLVVVLRAGVAA